MSERVFIITGAGRGIGFACARRFCEDGHRVVLADIDPRLGERALADLDAGKDRAIFVECDVSDKLEVHNLIAEALAAFGQIDGLINNAAILSKGGIVDLSIDDFDKVMSVNLRGAFLIEMREDRSRLSDKPYVIINMSSINDKVAMPDQLAYTISKGALLQMTRAMALELAPFGIRVNAIGPGSVKTELLAKVADDEAAMDRIFARTPLGRLAQPDEIAGVAAFLASEDASYITGQCIYVDGGRLALNYTMPKKHIES